MMEILTGRWLKVLVAQAGILILFSGPAWGQEHDFEPPLTRAHFEATKLMPADKGGENGDAAVLSDQYDVLNYDLDLRIDPAGASLQGVVALKFTSLVPSLQNFIFDFTRDLPINRVTYHGSDLLFSQLAGDSVVVQLPVALGQGQVDSMTVQYAGQPQEPSWDRGLVYRTYTLDNQSGPSVANMSQPSYAKYWWPCKDKPGDKALTSVSITVPDTLIAVSNGTLWSEEVPEAGWKTFRWREAYPMPTYLVSVAVSNYELMAEDCTTSGGSEVPLRHWVFPPDLAAAQVDFAPMCEMIDFCEDRYGPYPFQGEKYGHAEFMWSGAMEHTTVTSIGYTSLHGNGSRDWLIVHELGHQWFGDSLTPATWADIWLNEGFATYTEALWREHLGGRDDYLAYLDFWRDEATWHDQGPVYDPMPVFPGRVIYDKGSWILHMLRQRMGDTAFFSLIRDWANGGNRPGGIVTTEEFISLAESYAGQDLENFFWPYLQETSSPRILMEQQVSEGNNGPLTRVTVSLRQTQSRVFDNVFPVVVTTTAGQEVFSIHLQEHLASETFELGGAVQDVQLDPEASVLWVPAGTSSDHQGLILAYPNPAQDNYVYLRFKLDEPAAVGLKIYDARGRLVADRDLGRVAPELGFNEVVWDQKDDQGALVAAGSYWARLDIAGQGSVRRITVLH